jgi:hypothetical protein
MMNQLSFQPNRDRSIVMNFHQHMFTKFSSLGRDAVLTQQFDNPAGSARAVKQLQT